VLAVSAAAVAAGARSVAAIAEWATDAPWPILAALGVRCDPLTRRCQVPGEATIRRVLARVDGDAVDATVGAWLADRLRPLGHRRVLAVDGKRLRGSARAGHQVHLLAATDHHDGAVLAQRQVDGAPGEVPAFQPLLAGLDLAGVVVTADALHTQRDHASFLVGRGAEGLLAYDPQGDITGPHARGYLVNPDGSVVDQSAVHWGIGAEGGIVSNAADTGRFLVALMQDRLLGPVAAAGIRTGDFWSGGDTPSCGGSAYGRSGAGEGYKTNTWVSSDGSRVVVLLLNGRMADQATSDQRAAQALNQLYCAA
jgi:hypothetical protein